MLDGVDALVGKHLLQVLPAPAGAAEDVDGAGRFGMLETIREYAWECLEASGELAALRGQHAAYYLALAEEAGGELADLWGVQPATWVQRLDVELDNLRAALDWSLAVEHAADTERGVRATLALAGFWAWRGYLSEGRQRLAAALARTEAGRPTLLRAWTLNALGRLTYLQGHYAAARALYEEGLAIFQALEDKQAIARSFFDLGNLVVQQQHYAEAQALFEASLSLWRELGDTRGIANALSPLGTVAWGQGDTGRAWALEQEALTLYRELGDKQGMALQLFGLGLIAQLQGDYARARALHAEQLALATELGDDGTRMAALVGLGTVAWLEGDYARATALLEESLALSRQRGEWTGISWSLRSLGTVAWLQGNYARATELHQESLLLYQEAGDQWGITECLEGLGAIACREGEHAGDSTAFAWAARLIGAAAVLRETTGNPMVPGYRKVYEGAVEATCARLGQEQFTALWAEGRAMPLEQAIAYALKGEDRSATR